jgi:hypothetical protein
MADQAARLGATRSASTLLVLFIPGRDRDDKPIDQEFWVGQALEVLGSAFGGATAFPQGRGGVSGTLPRAASCCSTSQWSFNAKQARTRWSGMQKTYAGSWSGWEPRHARGPLDL